MGGKTKNILLSLLMFGYICVIQIVTFMPMEAVTKRKV